LFNQQQKILTYYFRYQVAKLKLQNFLIISRMSYFCNYVYIYSGM